MLRSLGSEGAGLRDPSNQFLIGLLVIVITIVITIYPNPLFESFRPLYLEDLKGQNPEAVQVSWVQGGVGQEPQPTQAPWLQVPRGSCEFLLSNLVGFGVWGLGLFNSV